MLISYSQTSGILWYCSKGAGITFAQMGDESFQVFCNEKSTCVKENNELKRSMHNSYDFYFKTVVIKNAEQTTLKWHKKIVSPETNSQDQFCAVQCRLKFQVQLEMICANDMTEHILFMVKVFSLQDVNIICSEMPIYFDMPCNYTINEEGTKLIIKT
jgi:hypothetical protein